MLLHATLLTDFERLREEDSPPTATLLVISVLPRPTGAAETYLHHDGLLVSATKNRLDLIRFFHS